MPSDSVPKCIICGKCCRYIDNDFCNKRIHSCEGCKSFFRRAVRNEKYWRCKGGQGQCDVEANSNRCKSCRLDRCLRAGMDWHNLINPAERQHIARLKMRLIQAIANSTLESNELQFLLRIVDAQSRIMHAYTDFDDEQASAFGNTIEQVLSHSENILGLAEHFSLDPHPFSEAMRTKFCAEIEILGFMQPTVAKMIQVDMLLCVGFIKVMPAFGRLAPADKILIARHARLPYGILANSYCALELDTGTWQRRNIGYPIVTPAKGGRFSQDEKMLKLAHNHFTVPVIPFTNAAISKEEFALILAIFISQTTAIPDLSDEARELLNGESARYSKILLRYLQCRLGSTEAGAKRFAECIHLVSHCFQQVHHSHLFFTYLETFYMRHCASLRKLDNSELLSLHE